MQKYCNHALLEQMFELIFLADLESVYCKVTIRPRSPSIDAHSAVPINHSPHATKDTKPRRNANSSVRKTRSQTKEPPWRYIMYGARKIVATNASLLVSFDEYAHPCLYINRTFCITTPIRIVCRTCRSSLQCRQTIGSWSLESIITSLPSFRARSSPRSHSFPCPWA